MLKPEDEGKVEVGWRKARPKLAPKLAPATNISNFKPLHTPTHRLYSKSQTPNFLIDQLGKIQKPPHNGHCRPSTKQATVHRSR